MSHRARSSAYERVEEISGHKYIVNKAGNRISFWDSIKAFDSAETAMHTSMQRMFKLEGQYDRDWIVRRITSIEDWLNALRAHLKNLEELDEMRTKIANLRNVDGRTANEAAEFLRKADQLEVKLREKEKKIR